MFSDIVDSDEAGQKAMHGLCSSVVISPAGNEGSVPAPGYIFVWREMRGCGNLHADCKIAKNGETIIAFIKEKLFILCSVLYIIVILHCYCKLLIVQSWKKMCK